MQSSLNFDIRDHLAGYLAGQLTRKDFVDWFTSATWDQVKNSDTLTADLIGEINLLLAEFSNGDLTENELQACLRPFVEDYRAVLTQEAQQLTFGAGDRPTYAPVTYQVSSFGITLVEVSS